MISSIVITGIFVVLLINTFLMYNFLNKKISVNRTKIVISEFATYISILRYYEDIAFDIVYKKEILPYSLEGWGPRDDIYKKAAKEFGKLVLDLLGDNLVDEFKMLHGNIDTLIKEISLHFYSRIESDEIRKLAVNDLLSDQEYINRGDEKEQNKEEA